MLDFNTNEINKVLNCLGTLLSVWLGAYLKDKKDNKASKQERFQRILELQLEINLIENYILAYKTAMDKKIFIDDICSLSKFDIVFDPNLKNYTFLTNYNVYFVSLLDIISRQTKLVQGLTDDYISLLRVYTNIENPTINVNPALLEQSKIGLKNTFSKIKETINGLRILIVTYNLVVKTTVQGNLDYAYNLKLGENIGSLSYEQIDDYKKNPLYINWSKIVESGRRNPKNINWLICSFAYKMRMIWVNFKGFFTYKPINCRKEKICKK